MRFTNLKFLAIFSISVVIILSFFFLVSYSNPVTIKEVDERLWDVESSFVDNPIRSLPLPDSITFAGEVVPLEKFYVKESFERELLVNTHWHSNTLLLLKRSKRFFSIIEPILVSEGLPDDLKYIAVIESGLVERIVSPSGAVGVWQFLSGTAKDYGLEVNKEIDERYHTEKSTVAACKFLKRSYDIYGNWAMAAASYNAGVRGINNQVEIQKNNNYYELLLNEETARYVYRAIALKVIFENPEKFGFIISQDEYYDKINSFDVVVSHKIDDFADFASQYDVTYRELKDANPWLRETFLTNKNNREYVIKIPILK